MAIRSSDGVRLVDRFKHIFLGGDDRTAQRLLMAVGMFMVLFGLIAVDFSPKTINGLEISKPSPATVLAPRTITLSDREKTQQLKNRAARAAVRAYRFDAAAPTKARSAVDSTFQSIRAVLIDRGLSDSERRERVADIFGGRLAAQDGDWLVSLDREQLDALEAGANRIVSTIMTDKISGSGLAAKRDEARRLAMAAEDQRAGKVTALIAARSIMVNTFMDRVKTNTAIAAAVDSVKPVLVRKLKGEIIVTEGEIVSPLHEHFLRELGLMDGLTGSSPGQVFGQAIIAFGLTVLGLIYLREFQPKVYRNNKMLLLVLVVLSTVSALAKGLAPLFPPYLIPVAGAAMLTTILVRPRAGIMMAITVALVTGIIVNKPEYWIYALMTGLFAVYLTANISHRSDLTRAGLFLMLASGLVATGASLMAGTVGMDVLAVAGWGAIGGFAAIILTIGTLQFLESAFNITTNLKLLELSNPTQPLLRELMVNAPGTYNHSIITGNLVESVAGDVGANPLLARTGAYYHDIGKIRRPFFFVENQYGDNPHDKTQPNLSYLIITAHVKEGMELAKKHRLPAELVDIIAQHHGTSLMSYFYSLAKETAKNNKVSENEFRYVGEKPKTKEAALIMLADAAEAAARAMQKPTHNRLEQMVRKIVKERLRDGQLDDSLLTLADLETVTRGYTQTLTTMYHTRIEYPENEPSEKKPREVAVGRIGAKPIRRPGRVTGS